MLTALFCFSVYQFNILNLVDNQVHNEPAWDGYFPDLEYENEPDEAQLAALAAAAAAAKKEREDWVKREWELRDAETLAKDQHNTQRTRTSYEPK